MADLSWSDFLPIGFVMFAGTLLAFTRRKAGRSLARREYPKLALRLGLRHEAPERSHHVGRLLGEPGGIQVRIESDDRARIVCYLDGNPGIEVRSYERFKRRPPGQQSFSLGSRADDLWMKTRYLREDAAPDLEAVSEAVGRLRPLRERIKEFTLDEERIECVFDFGSPPYLPGSVVERVLPVLVNLAKRLQASGTVPERTLGVSGEGVG